MTATPMVKEEHHFQLKAPSPWLSLVLPSLVGVLTALGTAQFVSGTREAKIAALEQRIPLLENKIQALESGSVKYEDMKLFTDRWNLDIQQIRDDLREVRQVGIWRK